METVQLQCGNCRQVIGILVEHMGGQVQCPHCRAIVQTPPRRRDRSAAETPVPPLESKPDPGNFFGSHAADDADIDTAPTEQLNEPAQAHLRSPAAATSLTRQDADSDLTAFKPRPLQQKSLLPVIFMIFLVPYAIMTTLFIIYLLWNQKAIHPLDIMPDPKKQGSPRAVQIIHNHPLEPHQIVALGKAIQVGKDGDLLVTPEHVRFTPEWDLELVLRARNISKNLKFEPINDFYLKYRPSKEKEGEGKPYTYLESQSKNVDTMYGGFLEFRKMAGGKEIPAPVAEIGPKEEELIVIRTYENYRVLIEKNIAGSNDSFLWRVQLRRGFVKYEGKDVSATAVIGVEFSRKQIEEAGPT